MSPPKGHGLYKREALSDDLKHLARYNEQDLQ